MYVQLSYIQSNCNRGWATVDSNTPPSTRYVIFITNAVCIQIFVQPCTGYSKRENLRTILEILLLKVGKNFIKVYFSSWIIHLNNVKSVLFNFKNRLRRWIIIRSTYNCSRTCLCFYVFCTLDARMRNNKLKWNNMYIRRSTLSLTQHKKM